MRHPITLDDCAHIAHRVVPGLSRELTSAELYTLSVSTSDRHATDDTVMVALGSESADAGVGVIVSNLVPGAIVWVVRWPGGKEDFTRSRQNAQQGLDAGATVTQFVQLGDPVYRGAVL